MLFAFSLLSHCQPVSAAVRVYLTGVPDYDWNYGCVGTASGNLMGFWDRHGFPDFYDGPVNNGLAPLSSVTPYQDISQMWASPAHVNDYYSDYEASFDNYQLAGREDHTPDCIGDFIGLSQMKWNDMAGECDGNLDGFAFVFWETNGARRVNFAPTAGDGKPVRDIPSGTRAWSQWRGYDCETFSQLADVNPTKPLDAGFTFADFKAEIDAGYPVLFFLQDFSRNYRLDAGQRKVNPHIHAYLGIGYYVDNYGKQYATVHTSWASGPQQILWSTNNWVPSDLGYLPLRGVVGFRPIPKIVNFAKDPQGNRVLSWHGPAADVYSSTTAQTTRVHGYVVEVASSLSPDSFQPVSAVLLTNTFTVTNPPATAAYFRVRLVKP